MFDIFTGCSGIDVKVPSTENAANLVWVTARADQVQNCRQIAATDSVTLKEDEIHKTSESSVQPAAQGFTFEAKGDLEQEPQPHYKKNLVCCPMLTRYSKKCGFKQLG